MPFLFSVRFRSRGQKCAINLPAKKKKKYKFWKPFASKYDKPPVVHFFFTFVRAF